MNEINKDIHQQSNPADESVSDTPEEGQEFATNYAIAIALGLPIGMVFGLLIFDNIALGMGIGLAFAPVLALVMKQTQKSQSQPDDVGQ